MDYEESEGFSDLLGTQCNDIPPIINIDYEEQEPEVKKESMRPPWTNTREDAMVISDSDEEPDIKKEPTRPPWTNTQENAILISDSEEEPEIREKSVEPTHADTSANALAICDNREGGSAHVPEMRRSLFKKKGRLTAEEQRSKIEDIQRRVVEKANKKKSEAGAGSIFKGLQGGVPSVSAAKNVSNEYAWMEVVSSDPDDEGERLRAAKKKYKREAKKESVSLGAKVALLKAEKDVLMRLKRLEKTKNYEDESNGAGVSFIESEQAGYQTQQESLFFSSEDTPVPSNKRPYSDTVQDSDMEDQEEADLLLCQKLASEGRQRPRQGPSKRPGRNPITAKTARESMAIAINAELERDQKKEQAKERAKKRSAKPSGKQKAVGPKPKKSGPKSKGVNSRNRPETANLRSILRHDVIADAQDNEDQDDQPTFTETRKAEALKELLASVPEESRRLATMDKNDILEATKSFTSRGRGSVRADGNGQWKLKGMVTSLYHYQLLGAAFMRDREDKNERPRGGIFADEMGFGKTVMMIANIVDGRPLDSDPIRTTLIVGTPSLLGQWMKESQRHCEPGAMGSIIRYHTGSRLLSNDTVESLKKFNVILTTYREVSNSWPKLDPPNDYTNEQRKQWIKENIENRRGPLHRIMFLRVILDEAAAIKNRMSDTSIACRNLMARYRWAMSGTPIQNSVDELYPYFAFLRVKHTGTFDIFVKNFLDNGSDIAKERLDAILKTIMLRRTHVDKMFNLPILKLPKASQRTTEVHFSALERSVYDIVNRRFIARINGYSKAGTLTQNYGHIFTMFLRLRQLTGHIFMIQKTIEDLLETEDVEKLMRLTEAKVSGDETHNTTLLRLRQLLVASEDNTDAVPGSSQSIDMMNTGKQFGNIVVSFKKYLVQLRHSEKWAELEQRSLCHSCRQPPDVPYVTSCNHVYCQECLRTLQYTAAKNDQDGAACLECGEIFDGSSPCEGLEELGYQGSPREEESPVATPAATPAATETDEAPRKKKKGKSGGAKRANDPIKWIEMGGHILPSAKTLAIKAQVLNWMEESPEEKIIIFVQFLDMITLLGRIFEQEGWGYCKYDGKMSLVARDEVIELFTTTKKLTIMIASLKSGGVGLNLTMASRVLIVDLWWNSSVEQQAFCRIFRIGQERETRLQRLVVRNTIDVRIREMQELKAKVVSRAMGDDGRSREQISVGELIRLFGPVEVGGDGKEFIFVDEADKGTHDDADDSEAV